VDVELTADVPADNVSKINAASIAVRELGYSRQRGLEQIGETDPVEAMKEARQEQLEDLQFEIHKQKTLAKAKIEIEQMVKELQGDEGEGLVQPQASKQVNGDLLKDPRFLAKIAERINNVQGQGFNPAQGGTPAVMADPEGEAVKGPVAKEAGNGR
jgi:hypothetical protein